MIPKRSHAMFQTLPLPTASPQCRVGVGLGRVAGRACRNWSPSTATFCLRMQREREREEREGEGEAATEAELLRACCVACRRWMLCIYMCVCKVVWIHHATYSFLIKEKYVC